MYKANGLDFYSKEDYVWGTADIEWEMYRNDVSDGNREEMPGKEAFINTVYESLMSGVSNGVWSNINMDCTSGSADVPEEIRFLGEDVIKKVVGEFWEDQPDKPSAAQTSKVPEKKDDEEKKTALCIMCHEKAEWLVHVIHDGQYDMEHMCDKCYNAFNYGFRQCLFQNIDKFPELKTQKVQ